MQTIRFKNDTALRRRLFTAEAFAHPAKGHLGMWQEMILRYSQEGETVLDPMSGVGATLLAALMGRTAILVELEEHFCIPMARSWEKMRQHPMLGYRMGQAVILRGDARHLPLCSADSIITSPPYEGKIAGQPPPAAPDGQDSSMAAMKARGLGWRRDGAYTRPPQVDAVVTSPSYEGTNIGRTESLGEPPFGGPNSQARGAAYSPGNNENVGNLRGQAYWYSVSRIYAECWRVLRPGGLLALVLKGFTRDGKYVDLPGQTEALLLEAGWAKHEEWRRELWSLSFWRILQKRRDPAAFDDRLNFETVLAFRKPEGAGQGVSLVLTSPPYEASVGDNKEGPNQTSVPGGWKANTVNKHGGYTRQVSAIIPSPPYGASEVAQSSDGEANRRFKAGEYQGDALKGMGLSKGYTRPAKP